MGSVSTTFATRRWPSGWRPGQPQGGRRPSRTYLGELYLDRYGHLYPESDAALRERLDAIYSAGQRDQDDAAVVELFRERS